jgi:hypothetical protein
MGPGGSTAFPSAKMPGKTGRFLEWALNHKRNSMGPHRAALIPTSKEARTMKHVKPLSLVMGVFVMTTLACVGGRAQRTSLPPTDRPTEHVEPIAPTDDGGIATLQPQPISQWATGATASSEYGDDNWSALQVIGKPDTPMCGDYVTAWASGTSTGKDWLEVTFDIAVDPTEINIYETYNPSAVIKVEVRDESGEYQTTWEGDPELTDECPFINNFTNPTGVGVKTKTIRITIDQSVNPGWNEIDAVELIGIP